MAGYTPPSWYKGYQSAYHPVDRNLPNWAPSTYKVSDFGATGTAKSSTGKSILNTIGNVLGGTLGQIGGASTDNLYHLLGDYKNLSHGKDILNSLGDVAKTLTFQGVGTRGGINGAKQQWKDWTDGNLTWGDVPGIGFLHGMDKGWKRGEDVLKDQFGVKNKVGQVAGGIGLDIAADPLTYLTGGLSAASKASKVAELEKMAELGKNIGLAGKFRNSNEFVNAATDMFKTKFTQQLPNVSESLIDKKVAQNVGKLAEELKTARNTTFNAHVNDVGFGLPFSKKYIKTGEYGANNWLHRSEALAPKELVDNLIHEASFGSGTKDLMEQAVKARYGVDHTGQLTKTMYDDLHGMLKPIIEQQAKGGLPEVNVAQKVAEHAMPETDFAKLMDSFKNQNIKWKDVQNQLDQILAQTGHDPALRSSVGSHLADMVANYWATKPAKNFSGAANALKGESMKWASNFLKESDKYKTVDTTVKDILPHGTPEANGMRDARVFNKQFGKMLDNKYNEMGDFKTNMEHFMDKKNPFNSRTLRSADKFTNTMADHISDAHSQRVGETARYSREMDNVTKYLTKYEKSGGNKKELMKQAIYLLEKKAPEKLGKNWLKNAPAEAHELAAKIKPVLDRVGSEEQKAGVLDQLKRNYFPHVVNKDPETMKAIQEFAQQNPTGLNGLNATSGFNKQRTSFKTMADADNYIEKLGKAIQKETDPDKIKLLQEQQDRVAGMFDTDVVSALRRRIKEGVRAKSMKEMQTKLSKYGMMKSFAKGESRTGIDGLTKIDKSEAKKLGLNSDQTHYIHPEVLQGMKRVDDIFTSKGMNKYIKHFVAFADVWRPLVTYLKPTHYINNTIGNVINNMAAGVKVSDYRAAGKLLSGYKNGTLTDAEMKIIDSAYKHNVISGGFLHDINPTFTHDTPTVLDKVGKALSDNKAVRTMRHHLGETPDDISRMANFISGMNKYGKTEMAAKQVRTYLFNYNELTNADRGMRTIVPFWNWTKRNVPLQMKTLMENPKFAMNIERVKQLFNEKQKGADWQKQSGLHVPTPITNLLNQDQQYLSFQSPTNDLNTVLHPLEFMGSMSPLPKMGLEMATNHQFFTGKPISYGGNGVQAKDVPNYVAGNMGILGDLYKLVSGKKTPTQSLIRLFNSMTPVPNSKPK